MVWSVFHAHTQANYDIIRDLKSRVKDKRETIKGRDAYPQIRLLMYTNTRTTQSNFSLSDVFLFDERETFHE